MKKILSALLSVLMLFNIAAVSTVTAADNSSILSGAYTFVDTCYSPDLGLYVAVAKDLSNSNTPGMVYTAKNVEEWKKVKTFSVALHSANRENRQTVVWWDKEQCFVMNMNNKIYISYDGATWKEAANESLAGSNTTVETNGDQLVISAGARIKIFNSLDETPAIYSIDSNAYGKTIGVTSSEPYRYAVTDQWKTWQSDNDGKISSATPNLSAAPIEMTWVEGFNGWIVLNNTAVLRVLSADEVKYTNFSSMKLSDGTTNDAKYTASGANADNVVVGTNTGKIYVAPNDAASLTVDTQWEIAASGSDVENTEEIRSVSAVNDGMFLAVSKTKIFMVMQTEDGWKYYDTSKSKMILDDTRIEIPETGTLEQVLSPVHYDYRGEISSDEIISFELQSALPDGVNSESISLSSVKLSVDSTVTGGHELIYKATTEKGKKQEFTVTIVDEDHVEIKGPDEMAIPRAGEETEIYQYSSVVVGTDGQDMSRETALEIVQSPDGIMYDDNNHTFTIDENVKDGKVVLKAYSVSRHENSDEKEIVISPREGRKIEIGECESNLDIPDSETLAVKYQAKLYDQINKEMPNDKIVWSVEENDISSLDGISISQNDGTLKIEPTAVKGVIVVKAASESNSKVFAQKEITLNYTDLRMAKEDLLVCKIDTSKPVTDNITLPVTGTYQSEITWESADQSIIKSDGTVMRPSREDKKVTLTASAKKNTSVARAKYEITVVKAENLCKNGDLKDGTFEGWIPKDNTVLAMDMEDEKYVLKSIGFGTYQNIAFTNNSSFAYEVKVKAPDGGKIRMVSKIAGTLAEIDANGEWQEIKASYDYRKQSDTFKDDINIEYSGELMIEYMKVYEVTLELNAVTEAVNKAVYTKAQSDIDAAKALLDKFYDLPVKNELKTKLDNINSSQGSGGGSWGSSGGGGGGSSSSSGGGFGTTGSKPQTAAGSDVNNISTPSKPDDNYPEILDTYLLKFKDMKDHWAREDVEYMGKLELVNGSEDGKFQPDANITRAEFAALITRTMGLEETEYQNSFFDVTEEDWYSGYVQTVRSNDLMNGYDGLFSPNTPITREEIAKVIVAAYNSKTNTALEKGKSLYFNDLDNISYWAYDYIVEAVDLGFVNGVSEEMFEPKQSATRAQAAVMLRRVYDKLNPSAQ